MGNSGIIRLPYLHILHFTLSYLEALFIGMLLLTSPSGTTVYRLDPVPEAAKQAFTQSSFSVYPTGYFTVPLPKTNVNNWGKMDSTYAQVRSRGATIIYLFN